MSASNSFKEVVGIIGGVGPEATNYFTSLLIKLRGKEAQRDQDHIPFLVFNNPQIPDRTEYLLSGKNNPVPELIHTGKLLKSAGATFLVIPCNTAHALEYRIRKGVGLNLLNMIKLTAQHIVRYHGENAKVGLLATDGTLKSNIYQKAFANISDKTILIIPEAETQKNVMQAIYSIKSQSVNKTNTGLLQDAAQELLQKGASIIILGCTEIPLALKGSKFANVDPMEILAKEVIKRTLLSEKPAQKFTYDDLINRTI